MTHPLFENLSESAKARITTVTGDPKVKIRPKQLMASVSGASYESGLGVCIVDEGLLAVSTKESNGRRRTPAKTESRKSGAEGFGNLNLGEPIAPLWRDDLYGELFLLGADRKPADVLTLTPVEVTRLNSDELNRLLNDPARDEIEDAYHLARNIARLVADKIQRNILFRRVFYHSDAALNIAQLFLFLHEQGYSRHHRGEQYLLPLKSNHVLGILCGNHHTTISSELNDHENHPHFGSLARNSQGFVYTLHDLQAWRRFVEPQP